MSVSVLLKAVCEDFEHVDKGWDLQRMKTRWDYRGLSKSICDEKVGKTDGIHRLSRKVG